MGAEAMEVDPSSSKDKQEKDKQEKDKSVEKKDVDLNVITFESKSLGFEVLGV
jgi:hypothetical protein